MSTTGNIKFKFAAMQEEFAKCAQGMSACFFCANDEKCEWPENECKFVWMEHFKEEDE